MTEYALAIHLGDDAMRTGHDIAQALRNAAAVAEDLDLELTVVQSGTMRDVNGNTVGRWTVTP